MSTFALAVKILVVHISPSSFSTVTYPVPSFGWDDPSFQNLLPSSLYGKNKIHFTSGDHTCPRNIESVFVKALDTFGEVASFKSFARALIIEIFPQVNLIVNSTANDPQKLSHAELSESRDLRRLEKRLDRKMWKDLPPHHHQHHKHHHQVGHPAAGGGRGRDQEDGQAGRQVHGQAERLPGAEDRIQMKFRIYKEYKTLTMSFRGEACWTWQAQWSSLAALEQACAQLIISAF